MYLQAPSITLCRNANSRPATMTTTDGKLLPPAHWLEQGTAGERNRLKRAPEIRLNPKARSVLGVVQVPTDFNMDAEAGELIRHFPGVEIRMQKLKSTSMVCTAKSFNDKGPERIADAAAVFQPRNYLSIVGLACTSMSFVLGQDVVDSAFEAAQPGTQSTDTARAQVTAIRAVLGEKKRKVAFLTPYTDGVHAANVEMLASMGFDVVGSASMGLVASEFTSQVNRTTTLWSTRPSWPLLRRMTTCS